MVARLDNVYDTHERNGIDVLDTVRTKNKLLNQGTL